MVASSLTDGAGPLDVNATAWHTAAQLALKHAAERPSATALSFLDQERAVRRLSFAEVRALAVQLAGLVQRPAESVAGTGTADAPEGSEALAGRPVIVVAIDDGPYLPIAELGSWLAGCCLTPVDPHDPEARIAGVLEEIPTLAAVVTKDWGDFKKLSAVADALQASHPGLPVIDLAQELPLPDQPSADVAPQPDALGLRSCTGAAKPEEVAYLWYTSGSTGKPKGCLIPHAALANWCLAKNPAHGIDSASTVLVASASTFDPSIGDIFATWAVGGTVAVVPRMLLFAHLGWVIRKLGVTHLTCTPSLWASFEGAQPGHPDTATLQKLCLGGERMGPQVLETWAGNLDGARLLNTYGTTECTVWQTLREMLHGDAPGRVGHCLPGNEIRVLRRPDGEEAGRAPDQGVGEVVEDGELGEVVQGGVQVGLGYFRRPEKTSAAFVTDPAPGLRGAWYRTGDAGRWHPEQGLEVLGRFDTQVKIRGMRVELGDIEQAVAQAGARHLVSGCCAVLRDGQVQAYVQLEAESAADLLGEVEVAEHGLLTEFLLQGTATRLPRHMLPSRFFLMRRLPLGRTGKTDRKSLPEPDAAIRLDRCGSRCALTKLESAVAAIWGEVLGIDGGKLGPQDHFLALGGNSVSVLRVSRCLTAEARARGAVVEPDGAVAFALAPERLIHSPRLQQYCHVLERAGVAHFLSPGHGADAPPTDAAADGTLAEALREAPQDTLAEEDVEAASELRINYTKLLATERRSQGVFVEEVLGAGAQESVAVVSAEAGQGQGLPEEEQEELDHAAWEQVPRLAPEEMLCRAATAGVSGIAALLLDCQGSAGLVEGGIPAAEMPMKGPAARGVPPHRRLGLTPLHLAVGEGHTAMASLLLERRADPNRMDYKGCPPLHKAAERGSRELVGALLAAGASLWTVDRARKFTALHAAAKAGNLPAVEALLAAAQASEKREDAPDAAADPDPPAFTAEGPSLVNRLDRWRRAPLHWTILNAHSCCAERLVAAGATVQGAAFERGKVLFFGPAAALAPGGAKRAKGEALEDPWELARERFGENGGRFRDLLQPKAQVAAS